MSKIIINFKECSREHLANPYRNVPYSQRIKMAGIEERSKNYRTENDGKYTRIISTDK